jgi:hypothetical protein
MQDRSFGNIREDMDVVGADGDTVGTVARIIQPVAVSSTASSTAEPAGELILKVESGILGLGTTYYIPTSVVRDVTTERVVLSVDKDDLDNARMGWDTYPPWLKD